MDAGSNEISVFEVTPNGLIWLSKVSSGGTRPISLTNHKNLLYVLNAGGRGNITGFKFKNDGSLTALDGSTMPLSDSATGPAQIEFNPEGTVLVVTEKAKNLIDTYTIGENGIASGPIMHASAGQTPFGFEFDKEGKIIVSEAFGGAAGKSVLSSYNVSSNGDIHVISGNIATHQTAACWVVITNNNKFAYTTNTGSGSISGYRVSDDGSLSLLTSDGRTGVIGDNTSPIDMALNVNSRYLYTLNAKVQSISAFKVNHDGSLSSLSTVNGLIAGSIGLAAF